MFLNKILSLRLNHFQKNKGIIQIYRVNNVIRLFSRSQNLFKKSKSKKDNKIDDMESGFRLNALNLFLTYSKIEVNLEEYENYSLHKEIIKQLKEKKEFSIKEFLICVELHKNGIPHSHVLLILNKKCDTRNPRALDLIIEDKVIHGDYKRVKNKKASIEYVCKSNVYYTDMNFELRDNKMISPELKAFNDCKLIGQKKALENYVFKYPERALTRLSTLKNTLKNLEWVLKPEEQFIVPKFTLNNLRYKNIKLKAKMLFLVKHNLFNRTPIFLGRGGLGKSLLIKAIMKALAGKKLLIRNKEQAINLTEDHDVLGYDEFKLDDFSDQDFINLLDEDETSVIRVLFNTVRKKRGLKVILGTNKIKNLLKRQESLEAILRRTIFIKLDKSNSVKYPKEEDLDIEVDFGDDFRIEEYIDNIEEYSKHHHYSNKHPITLQNYQALGLEPPNDEDSESD